MTIKERFRKVRRAVVNELFWLLYSALTALQRYHIKMIILEDSLEDLTPEERTYLNIRLSDSLSESIRSFPTPGRQLTTYLAFLRERGK